MLTRKVSDSKAGLLAGVVLGLAGQAAAAADVVVAYGGEAARLARAAEAEFQTRMSENVRSLNEDIKANVEREIRKIKVEPPQLRLALADELKRG